MKKLLMIICLISLLSPIAHSEEQEIHTNYNLGFTVKYPSTWQLKEKYGIVSIEIPFTPPSPSDFGGDLDAMTLAPFEMPCPTIVEIGVEDLNNTSMDLNKYVEIKLSICKNNPSLFPDFEFIEKGDAEIAEQKSVFYIYKFNFTAVMKPSRMKRIEYYFFSNGRFYSLSYSAPEEDFDKYLPQAEGIIKSIKIIKHPTIQRIRLRRTADFGC